jgi:N-acetylglucosamine-6-phosphate deacetylase
VAATTVIAASGICAPGRPSPGWVAAADGVIHDIATGPPPAGALDLGDALLVPGFIDLQINGIDDCAFATCDAAAWRRAGATLVQHGVTACLPTLISASLDRYDARLSAIASWRDDAERAHLPAVLGAHLEGPFLGGAPGAHPVESLRPASVQWLERTIASHPGVIRLVTLAPEADPDFTAIRALRNAGIVVALGHSDTTYDEARAAADAGATLVTHLFNGMGPMHHRAPGLAGAALDDKRLTPTLIADLVHVHPAMVRLAIARKPNIALVSDAVATGDGVHADGSVARLPDGRLAGSLTLLDEAVANVVGLGVPVERAIELATAVPAAALGLDDRGRLEAGARADIVALDPSTLAVRAVWLAGDRVVGAWDETERRAGP